MTIAIALKVGDGVVLGADSASTLSTGVGVVNVYFNAEKIFNVVKGLPIGLVFYGLGGLDRRSLTAVAKDLRSEFSDPLSPKYLDPTTYTVDSVAQSLKEYFYDQLYQAEFGSSATKPVMGIMIAGFSAPATQAEVWLIEVDEQGICSGPTLTCPQDSCGLLWRGQPETLNRLVNGWSFDAYNRLMSAGMSPQDARNLLNAPAELVSPAMPIQDAIELVNFLAETTVGYVRFYPGSANCCTPHRSRGSDQTRKVQVDQTKALFLWRTESIRLVNCGRPFGVPDSRD